MLTIDHGLIAAMVAHARDDHPDEACGVLAGPIATGVPQRQIRMQNVERSMTFYRFDSGEHFRVWRELEDADEFPVVIYHSHTATEAYPSRSDITLALEPDSHYVLVSTADPDVAVVRSFRIIDQVVTEERIEATGEPGSAGSEAVQSYKFAHSPDATVYDC